MSLMQCRGCPAKFVVGLLRCPRCQTMSDLYADAGGGASMPKISVEGGASNAGDPIEDVVEETADLTPDAPAADDVEVAEEVVVEEPDPAIDEAEVSEPAKAPSATAKATKKAAAKP